MILPDVNLLMYAHNDRAPQHAQARQWWEECLNGLTPVGLAWVSINGFLRLSTHSRVMVHPMKVSVAVGHVREWLAQPPVRLLQPSDEFTGLFLGYLEELGTAGNLTTDACLAAMAVEHQAVLHSADTDFHRFRGLRWKNPLE